MKLSADYVLLCIYHLDMGIKLIASVSVRTNRHFRALCIPPPLGHENISKGLK